jgi:hypothetical protein
VTLINDLNNITFDETIKLCSFNTQHVYQYPYKRSHKNSQKHVSTPGLVSYDSLQELLKLSEIILAQN